MQLVIQKVKDADLDFPVQFVNYSEWIYRSKNNSYMDSKMKFLIIFIFILFSNVIIQPQTICSDSLDNLFKYKIYTGEWMVYWDETHCISFEKTNQKVDTLFSNLYLKAKDNDGCLVNNRYKLLSVVGPFVSFLSLKFQDCEGGNHPTDYVYYSTLDLQTEKTISLTKIFESDLLFRSLIKTSWIKKYLHNNLPKDLKELVENLDGGCDISFMYLLVEFAFKSISDSSIIVQFGLMHGCEANKGNFTNFEVELPIPVEYLDYFNDANKNKSTIKYLVDKNYLKKLSEMNR